MTESYLIIEIDSSKQLNFRPFKKALTPVLVKKGRTSIEDVWCYSLSVNSKDGEFVKVGHTSSTSSFGSKKRYCPWIFYNGVFQIQKFGNLHEVMLHAFLGQSVNNSEWFVGASTRLDQVVNALDANEHFQRETAYSFAHVTKFAHAFTGKANSNATNHLSLYRVRYKGQLYELTEQTVDKSLKEITGATEKKNDSSRKKASTKKKS